MQQPVTALMRGGLNITDPAIALAPGTIIACENYEPDVTGYTSFEGYERFDGNLKPSDAATAGERETRRQTIQPVPGKGGVLKTWRVNDENGVSSYAVRENASDANVTVYRATGSGWAAVPLADIMDFSVGSGSEILAGQTVTGATSGETATVGRVVRHSGTFSGNDAAGYFELVGASGAFTDGEGVSGTGWTATGDTSGATLIDRTGLADVRTHSFFGSNRESSYLVTGSAMVFEINGTNVFPIKILGATAAINHISVFANHLFLGAGGSLINSAPNDPRDFTPEGGASEIVLGNTIEGLQDEAFNSLIVYGADSTSYLTGTSTDDFILQPINRDTAPRPGTMQIAGSPVYADRIGVRRLATTEAFGDWRTTTLTAKVEPYFRSAFKSGVTPVASMRVRDRDIYRLFLSDGSVLSLYFGGEQVEVGRLSLPIVPSCSWVATGTDTDDVVLIGATDGYVYQFDIGGSMDGENIVAFVTLSPFTAGSARTTKRFVSAAIELLGQPNITFGVNAEYDYGDPSVPVSSVGLVSSTGGVGGSAFWDTAIWDETAWSGSFVDSRDARLDGKGRNVVFSMRTESAHNSSHTITAVTFNCIYRSVVRVA